MPDETPPLRRWTLEDLAQKYAERHAGQSDSSTTGPRSTSELRGPGHAIARGFETATNLVEGVSRFISPAAIIEAAREGIMAYRGYRVLAFGASSVGKSTLWKYLETGQAGAKVEKTFAPRGVGDENDPLFRVRTIRGAGIVATGIRAFDLPGDAEYRGTWKPIVELAPPKIVIFMADHDRGAQRVDTERGYTPERMEEHRQACADMRKALLGVPEAKDSVKAVLAIANKHDVWPDTLSHTDIFESAGLFDSISTLASNCNASARFHYCSALTGDNIIELMKIIFTEARLR